MRKYEQVEAARKRKAENQIARRREFEARRKEWEQKVQVYALAKVAFAISWLLATISLVINALRFLK